MKLIPEIEWYLTRIPDPLLIKHWRNKVPKIVTFQINGRNVNAREYYRSLYSGREGEIRFHQDIKEQRNILFKHKIWTRHRRFTKNYYEVCFLTAPLCENGCGVRECSFTSWGELIPNEYCSPICWKCLKKLKEVSTPP